MHIKTTKVFFTLAKHIIFEVNNYQNVQIDLKQNFSGSQNLEGQGENNNMRIMGITTKSNSQPINGVALFHKSNHQHD